MNDAALQHMIDQLETEAARRRQLGGYSADALAILFITESAKNLGTELLALRKDVRKLKRQK